MNKKYDFIVIGGGHNGLTAACYLARSGHSVIVLEKQPIAGGMSISQPFVEAAPNHLLSPGAIDTVFIRQTPIIQDLNLEQRGLSLINVDPGYGWINEDGDTLMLFKSVEKTVDDIKRFSRKDANNYLEMANIFQRILKLQGRFMGKPLDQSGLRDMLASAIKLVGDKPMRRTLGQLMAVSAYEAIAENFESEALRGLYAYWCAIACPPDTEGSGVYLASFAQVHMLGCSRPKGGMSSLINALSDYLRTQGGELKTNAPVTEILVENEQATGVVLANGEIIQANCGVLTACAPQVTFGKLLGNNCPDPASKQLDYMPANASNMGPFKIDMALTGPLTYTKAIVKRKQLDGVDISGASLMTGTLDDHLDHTRKVRLGSMGDKPPIWMTLLSNNDPSIVPKGQTVAYFYTSIPVHSHIDESTLKQQATDMLMGYAHNYLDGFDTEIGRTTLMPMDFEHQFGTPNGCLYHVDMVPTRLGPLRPARGMGGSNTDIKGLYLAGSGSHPGGGVFGLPGKFAAEAALKQ